MVRRPPGTKSIEEVLCERLAAEGRDAKTSSTSTTAARGESMTRRRGQPSSLSVNSRRKTGALELQKVVVPHAVLDNPGSSNTNTTLDRIQQISATVADMNERLHQVETRGAFSPTQTNARPSISSNAQQIDQYIQQAIHDLHGLRGSSHPSSTSLDPVKGAQVNHAVREIRSTVRRLDRVFYEVATGDKQRHIACTKICAVARGFITRRRYQKMWNALGQWRTTRAPGFISNIHQFAAHEEFIKKQINRMQYERTQTLLHHILAELRDITLLNIPLRRRRITETERRFRLKQKTFLFTLVMGWKQCALGPRSRTKVIAQVKIRHLAARARLESLQRFSIVTTDMIHEEFLKENIRLIRSKHSYYLLLTYFRLFVVTEYQPNKKKMQQAITYNRSKVLHRIWKAWILYYRSTLIDNQFDSGQRTLERFEKYHHLKRIDTHYQQTHMRKHMNAWYVYCQRITRVRRLFERNTTEQLKQLFQRWFIRSQYQHQLRMYSVEQWHAYSRRLVQIPFRAWYIYTNQRQTIRRTKESICIAYRRRAHRHMKYMYFRVWKHLVLFGSVEGIHSNLHLLHSLEDQKRLCLGLEQQIQLYQMNIHALETSIETLEAKVIEKQNELIHVQEMTQSTRFSIHQAEQTIGRIQGMIEAVRMIHGGTIERVERMFKDNPLLTHDLNQLIQMQVEKRFQVIQKMELDEMEMDILKHVETDGYKIGRNDLLVLHRVKWVLERMDLTQDTNPSNETIQQLCALFEFIRTGETKQLNPHNDPLHHERLHTQLTPRIVQEKKCVMETDLRLQTDTWHTFLSALTIEFAPERMLMVKERLLKRVMEMNQEIETMKSNPHRYNLYSGSSL